MDLLEEMVREALESLRIKGLACPANGFDSRVNKYEHRIYDAMTLDRREVAILCELLLRGPQTPGELRGRAQRMYSFEGLDDVLSTLKRLIEREPPLVAVLPRRPGTKEMRYRHLLSRDIDSETLATAPIERSSRDRIGLASLRAASMN
jgi:uncharacterized protein YceH (UPF0502 family)